MRPLPFVAALMLVLAGGAGAAPPAAPSVPAAERAEANGKVFFAAWSLVKERYYDPQLRGVDWSAAHDSFAPDALAASTDAELYRAINRMLSQLKDAHLAAVTADQVRERQKHERIQVGIGLIKMPQGMVVTEVSPGGSAEAAGVKPGWILVRREGQPLEQGIGFNPVPGQLVRFDFLDASDRPVSLRLAEGAAPAHRQAVKELPDGTCYLRIDVFDPGDGLWLVRQLRSHRSAPAVMVDLRRNSGGRDFTWRYCAGQFFKDKVNCGELVTRAGKEEPRSSWEFLAVHYRGRLTVLTSRGTASAGELFAAVMQLSGRGRIVGQKTMGAVEGARLFLLPDGGSLEIPIDDYRLANGQRLEGIGVTPDIIVPAATLADIRAGRDPELAAALADSGTGGAQVAARANL